MHRSQQRSGRLGRNLSRGKRAALACAIDALESRRLFAGETATAIPSMLSTTATPITLNEFFTNSNLPGTLVTFKTNLGVITVSLTDAATPHTVANFLNYVNNGAYSDTIFHRTSTLTANASGGSPTAPADIIQGGGYVVNGRSFKHIATNTPVDDEFSSESFGDIAGTLAMAKTSSADSATSEWFFNVHDNTSALDTPTTDSNGVSTSYTVFGKVLTGMDVVDEIAALPTYNVSSSLNTVPVTGLTEGEAKKNFPIQTSNLVFTDSITSQPGVNYTVTSDNNALVTPKLTNGVLSFTYASGKSGSAQITVLAKSLDGSSASDTFTVTVPNSATPTAGPVAADVMAPNIVTGTTGTFSVLSGATDSVAALNPDSVAVITQPTHGTAIVNASSGQISYTPTAGYTGTDTLTFTVADSAGTVSNTATVSLNVVGVPINTTIGTRTARSLTFTQPNGVVGHLTVNGGNALITFASSDVAISTANGVVTATGAGASLASIIVTDTAAAASLTLTASGAVSIGSLTDVKAMSIVDAPNATLTGNATFKSIKRLVLAAAADSTLSLGSGFSTALVLPNATNTSVTDTGSIASITSTQFTSSDGGSYSVTTPSIGRLSVTGAFADALNLSATGTALVRSTVGQASGIWTVGGAIGNATFGTPVSTWSLAATGRIGTLTVTGNLTNSISAATIGSLSVTGTSTGATIATTDTSTTKLEINRLKFGGAVATSSIKSSGEIGRITAPSLTSANISSGSITSLIDTGALSSSTVSSTGEVKSLSASSVDSTQINSGQIGSLSIAGTATSATIQTNKTLTGKQLQIGKLHFGGAVSTSSVATSGAVGNVTAASLSGTQIVAGSISSLVVSGATGTSTISTDAGFSARALQIGRVIFGGAVTSSSITSVGNVGHISAASLTGSHIYAGLSSTISAGATLPTATTDFTSDARISSVVLGNAASAFSNTIISAEQIGSLILGNVTNSNGGTAEGIGAEKIGSVRATLVSGGTIAAAPAQLKSAAAFAAYVAAKKLTLSDFEIAII